ncbi:MAG: class I SAM-dependent methyltransferase [Flavobacteriaceae bacterium]
MDKKRIAGFADTVYRDMAGALTIGMAYLGQRTGLFRAMAESGPITPQALATLTGLQQRYVEEWLGGMTAAGWIEHTEAAGTFTLPAEHAWLLASEGTDHFIGGFFLALPSMLSHAPQIARAFREGGGIHFCDYDSDSIEAIDMMSAGLFAGRLASYWLPHVPGAVAALENGGSALDVGCGAGRAVIALASAFPRAAATGVDTDARSIGNARNNAKMAGSQARFVEGGIDALPETERFDLVTMFDCLHDIADPAAALAGIRARMRPGATLFVMEPKVADRLADNVNPMGTIYYGFSLFHCMTQSLAEDGAGLGACMGPERTMALIRDAGFSNVSTLPIKSQTNSFYAATA